MALLREWLEEGARIEAGSRGSAREEYDLLARVGRSTLVVEIKLNSDSAAVRSAAEQVLRYARGVSKSAVPVVAVPYMSETGQKLCDRIGVSWFDLSGNAHIVTPSLRILVAGKPNQFKRLGRPSSVFTPRSSRVVRQLLVEPERNRSQRDLARLTDLDEGFTSRIVRRLEADGLIDRDAERGVRAKDPNLLLDAWHEAYDFKKHRVIRGHVVVRSPDEGQRRLVEGLTKKKIRAAATGLGAAWLMTKFAGFRLVTVFIEDEPEEHILSDLGFRYEERGANTWLVIPNDPGVFTAGEKREGIQCVHPVQVYLDLKGHPERANEAAVELRNQLLTWRR
jgi:hypothetical protein